MASVMKKYEHPYVEQWNRILRLRKALAVFIDSEENGFEESIDLITSFFIQCAHLSDWLVKSGYDKKKMWDSINSDKYLRLCKELADNQKHQKITHYTPKNEFIDNGLGITTPIAKTYDPFRQKNFYGVQVWEFGRPVDVLELADGSIQAWRKIINDVPHSI